MIRRSLALILVCGLTIAACNSGSDSPPTTGTLAISVLDAGDSLGIVDARIVVIDGATGESLDLLTTDANGDASGVFDAGTLQLYVSSQDYSPSPPSGIPPLPVQITAGETTVISVKLNALPAADRGWISGQVLNHEGAPASGALVVVTDAGGDVASTTAHSDGSYVVYNVSVGDATVNAFLGGNNFEPAGPVAVTASAVTEQNLTAAGAAFGEIYGHISFTAISGSIIDITLLHPETRDPLPGLRVETDAGASYVMTGVPNGEFEIVASLDNDGYVLDPDTSVTQGIPTVVVSDLTPTLTNQDFKVTGSIELTNPPSLADAAVPELGPEPTFTWLKASSYASADFYAIEVVDESGNTIWGGFDSAANGYTPFVTVAQSNEPSAAYNFDSTASAALENEHFYQLRIYAAVTDIGDPKGFRLLSASETLDGLFRVTIP